MPLDKEEKEIIKKLIKLSKEIKKHSNFYYNLDKPKISDREYDELVIENSKLEIKYPHLVLDKSPNNTIGAKVKSQFEKIEHASQMYSLGNAFDKNDLDEFVKKSKKFLNFDNNFSFEFISEPKIDGLSLNLSYENGKLISAGTRGDGLIGENVTQNILNIRNIPKDLSAGLRLIVNKSGRILQSELVRSSGNLRFDNSALQAVSRTDSFYFYDEIPDEIYKESFKIINLKFNPGND